MLWTKRCYRSVLRPVSLLVVAVFWGELLLQIAGPILPELLKTRVVEAAIDAVDPDGNGNTTQGTTVNCGGGTNFQCIDDGDRSPTTPTNVTTDYVELSRNQADSYTLGTLPFVGTVNSVTMHFYHLETRTNYNQVIGLFDQTELIQYGTSQTLANKTSAGWDSVTFSGLSLSQAQLDGLRFRVDCTRPSGGGNAVCRNYVAYAEIDYTPANQATVAGVGTQQNVSPNATDQYIGASFSIVADTGSANVTSITVSETGTIDAANDLSNVKLFYDIDSIVPLDCAGESYSGTETQYGGTAAGGFSGANGSLTFTGSVGISALQTMCLYVVTDVGSGASSGDTIEVQITDPSADVVGDSGLVVSPGTAVALPGTTVVAEPLPTQTNYHWRNDDGSETAASSAVGSQNTVYNDFPKSTTKRLRMQVSNEGTDTTASIQYRLEFASKTGFSTCADVNTGWTDVGASGGDFDMSNSTNLTDGANTTNVTTGGVSDPGGKTFLSTNAAVKDTSSQTAGIALTSSQFVEFEYSIISSGSVTDGNSYCFRLTDAGTPISDYTNYPELVIAADINVSSDGSHTASSTIPSTDQYAGGTIVISDTGGASSTITQIVLSETGTVRASTSLENVTLRYDLDITNPYTCDDHSYSVSDTQYGSAGAFNDSSQLTFSGSVTISTTQTVCLYVEYDVNSTAVNGETGIFEISDPSTEVTAGAATVAPASPIAPAGAITFETFQIEQTNYHWRNDDGSESAATSATGGSEDTAFGDFPKNDTYRLRFAIGNTGQGTAPEATYTLQWGQKAITCDAVSSWTDVGAVSDEWAMADSPNVTQGGDTTDIIVSNGGVSDPASVFLTNNNAIADTSDTTGSSTLAGGNYLDAEFAIQATNVAVQGATYCFRVVANNEAQEVLYTSYPEATIKLDTDYKIQRGVSTITGTTLTITAGVDYDAPSSTANAFIRINNTQLTGAGPNTGAGNSNADDVTAHITNPTNLATSITFARPAGIAANTRVSWEIVEYTGVPGGENEMIVRSAAVATYAGGTTVSGGTVAGVSDNNDVVVFITGQNNTDVGRNSYDFGLSTAAWNTGTNQPDFTRGAGTNNDSISYAVVEFTGSNWRIQRAEHTYTAVASTETQAITAVNSLSRAFLHVQKRTGQNTHADFGHEVWLSGLGQISFLLDGAASTPSDHTTVVWVIENTQSVGQRMVVTRASGNLSSGGASPESNLISIGKTLDDLSITSLVVNNRSGGGSRSWPEPILATDLVSNTQFELWRSDTGEELNYRAEIIEWPTAGRKLEQNYFRIYEDNGLLLPTDAWPSGTSTLGENAAMTADDSPMAPSSTARIRMTLTVTAAAMPANLDTLKLQYASTTGSCSALTNWFDLGDPGSTTAQWRGFDNVTPVDGSALSGDPPTGGDLLISIATVAGTYEEQNETALNPHTAFPGDEVEFDWVVQHNGAEDKTSYCFRMVEADGQLLENYIHYPVLRTIGYDPRITDWRWYDDENSLTPSVALAAENVAPSNVANDNLLKLRLVLRESSGRSGTDVKFAVQFSDYADFSSNVVTLTASSSCEENSLWCYADGAGNDNDRIVSSVISSSDVCTDGTQNACGTYNEATATSTATFDHVALTSSEFEFTLQNAGARVNTVYYFRLYDVVNDEVVPLFSGASYPSVVTEGANVVISTTGLVAGALVAGEVLDATSTPTSIDFDSVVFGDVLEAAQQITVDTNATEGYQTLLYAASQLMNSSGQEIQPISSSNLLPASWSSACLISAPSCFGYHTTDGSLAGGSARFAPLDSFAALSTTTEQIMYSSVPTLDTHELLFKIRVDENQPPGLYETNITYLIVPVH